MKHNIDLHIKAKFVYILEENTGANLFNLVLGKGFLAKTQKTLILKRKNQLNSAKVKFFCSSNDIIEERKNASHTRRKDLSPICK